MFKATLVILMLASPLAANAWQLPDPTERTSMSSASGVGSGATRWVLQSTLVASDRRIAVINGETVMVGDRVNGARVIAIDTYVVRLRTADGPVELTLTDRDPKQVAGGGNE